MGIGLDMGLLGSTGRRIAVSARSILYSPRNGVREKGRAPEGGMRLGKCIEGQEGW